ncbi:putative protease inhibitor [Annulohypoxylon truncatum]|uniref:putative protease inhibitor n=1 Tax=Annulohypoxylon truncatum TaxID=327061 RepID=UPI0020079CFB|nr:putative protease inhibitor [Annulohypoxylon truncatum]KAI1208350.1 putative protease inhibitor [Annulohypoxylon truncatum]
MPSQKSVKAALSLIENDKSKVLGVSVGKVANIQPGQYIPKADAQAVPELSFSDLSPEKTYLVVGLDLDAPFPSFGVLGPILHWIQPGFKAEPKEGGGFSLKSTEPFISNWIGPAPPPISAPHRYTFFLYEQPEGLDAKKYAPPGGKEMGNGGRMRYDLDAWAKEIKLGPVLAFNYFNSN